MIVKTGPLVCGLCTGAVACRLSWAGGTLEPLGSTLCQWQCAVACALWPNSVVWCPLTDGDAERSRRRVVKTS